MAIDNQYVRRYRQHIPFYKSDFPFPDRRIYWHHKRCLCDPNCIFGIPVVRNQYLMFVVEDDNPTGIDIIPFGVGQNSTIELCCLDDGDTADCPDLNLVEVQGQTFFDHRSCIIDGLPIQFNYLRIKVPNDAACGLQYLKIKAYEGTVNERIFYSQPVKIYDDLDATRRKLLKLNINDRCGIGGVQWSEIFQGWPAIDGYEVYLPELSAASFVEEITDEEVEEDGKGNEIQIFEKTDWKYEFDTGYVPDYYAEIIKEITSTSNNAVTIPDRDASHYVEISRAFSTVDSDGDGCLMNVNMTFIINKYNKDACCVEDACECPQDNAMEAISYTTDQVDAEVGVEVGHIYLVPDGGVAINNPDWQIHDNEIATWNGAGWDYAPNDFGLYVNVLDVADFYISKGIGSIWEAEDTLISNIIAGSSCEIVVKGIIPELAWAKLQFEIAGSGTWNDFDGQFYDANTWANTVLFTFTFTPTPPILYNFILIPLDIGCGLDMSPVFNYGDDNVCDL